MTSVPETRSSLLLRLRDARDQHAWSTFLEIYQPLIYRVIRNRRVQDADAREVTQEVLLAVANSIDQWEADPQRGTFRGWLTTITRNLVVNFLIKQSRHPRGSGDSDFRRGLESLPAPASDESALFDVEERRQIFRWAAGRIRPEFREANWQAFWRTAVEGQGAIEVARELGISPGLVYVSRNRIMKRLREKVEEFRKLND
ncbi:MAG: sigma-70 family RNA polymerase sigma factor [Schlesneria sp.]